MLTNVSQVNMIAANCVTMCLVPLSASAGLDIPWTLTAQHVEVHDAFILRSLCVHVMSLHDFVHSSVCDEVSVASENVYI